MMLKRYFSRLHNTIISRKYIEIEYLIFDIQSADHGLVEGRFCFPDGSLFEFDEVVEVQNQQIAKVRYAYHYQNASDEMVFRYDNVPHHPHIFTYPHHKHVGTAVEPTTPPDISEVLSEIDGYIFN